MKYYRQPKGVHGHDHRLFIRKRQKNLPKQLDGGLRRSHLCNHFRKRQNYENQLQVRNTNDTKRIFTKYNHFHRNNKVEDEIKFNNVHQLSGCEFGGQNLDTMFVTTSMTVNFIALNQVINSNLFHT